jgi:hypothetical protein
MPRQGYKALVPVKLNRHIGPNRAWLGDSLLDQIKLSFPTGPEQSLPNEANNILARNLIQGQLSSRPVCFTD